MDYLFDGIGSATDEKLFGNMDLTEASDFLTEGWSASPDDLLDSFLSINGDFLKELDDSQNMQFTAISEANAATATSAPSSAIGIDAQQQQQQQQPQPAAAVDDFRGSSDGGVVPELDLSAYVNFGAGDGPMSSSASDSGLSMDNMDMDCSPDYEPLSPAMSSPGPSISERGGKNSPARSLVSEPGQPIVCAPVIMPAVAPVVAAAVPAVPQMPAVQKVLPLPQAAAPPKPPTQQQRQQQLQPVAKRPVHFVQQQRTPAVQATFQPVNATVNGQTAAAGKPKTLVFTCPPTNPNQQQSNNNTAKAQYVIERPVAVAESANAQKRPAGVPVTMMHQPQQQSQQQQQHQQPIKKELKIYKMSSPGVLTQQTMQQPTVASVSAAGVQSTGQPAAKKINIQMKDGAIRTLAAAPQQQQQHGQPGATCTYVINKAGPTTTTTMGQHQFAGGVRKLVRVQQPGTVNATNGTTTTSRSILLPVSFQDVKDFRTIKIINASSLNNKSANIKLAAANMLQQSKQGLVQKNVLFSKEQLIDDSQSDICTSDADSYIYEDIGLVQMSSGGGSTASSKASSVVSVPAFKPTAVNQQILHRNVIMNPRGSVNANNVIRIQSTNNSKPKPMTKFINHQPIGRNSHSTSSDADDDDDEDDDEDDDDDDGVEPGDGDSASDYMLNGSAGSGHHAMSANGTYPKLLLTNEEKRLLDKEGIQLPGNYPLTKHEERELKRIRRKIRNKISAQDSRKRKKEYVDGLEERVKQCTDENQTLIKRLKLLQSQHSNLSHQVKKLQAMLSKTGGAGGLAGAVSGAGGKMTQPATCLMVLLLSLALVAAPNLKLGQSQADIADAEQAADALQDALLMQQQNRRSLLFDAKEQQQQLATGGDDLMLALEDGELMFGGDAADGNEHDYATARDGGLVALNKKTTRGFVDFDLDDDALWKPPSFADDNKMATVAGAGAASFMERAAEFQDAMRRNAGALKLEQHGGLMSTNGMMGGGSAAAGYAAVKLETMEALFPGAEAPNIEAKKLNESKMAMEAPERQTTILMQGA